MMMDCMASALVTTGVAIIQGSLLRAF